MFYYRLPWRIYRCHKVSIIVSRNCSSISQNSLSTLKKLHKRNRSSCILPLILVIHISSDVLPGQAARSKNLHMLFLVFCRDQHRHQVEAYSEKGGMTISDKKSTYRNTGVHSDMSTQSTKRMLYSHAHTGVIAPSLGHSCSQMEHDIPV